MFYEDVNGNNVNIVYTEYVLYVVSKFLFCSFVDPVLDVFVAILL